MRPKYTDDDLQEIVKEFQRKNKKKTETSKVILIIIAVTCYIVLFIGTVLAWFRGDSSVLRIIATGIMSSLSVAIGFYYWKAKQENILKLKATYKDDFVEVETSGNSYYNDLSSSEQDYNGNVGRDISNGV